MAPCRHRAQRGARRRRNRQARVFHCGIDDAPYAFAINERFDIIHVGDCLPNLPHPVRTLNALQNLLARGGVIAIGSPNLDSKQQEWFGPAWSHWHLTRFHALYSRKALIASPKCSTEIVRAGSFSHADRIAFSMHFKPAGWPVHAAHLRPQRPSTRRRPSLFRNSGTYAARRLYFRQA